nr:ribonuclease H-like domain-containing protein [Tanacetum cinerariifolium]
EEGQIVQQIGKTKDLHTADYTQLYDFLKYNQKEVDELKVERIAKIQDPLALMANSNNPYATSAPHQDLSPFNQNFLQQPMTNPEDIMDPTTAMNMALALMAKAFKLNYSTPTNNNQRISSNPRNRQIAQPAGSESHPSMLNKENYVPWLSRLLRYAKSRPNGKLIHNSILNGPYVRRMIPEPGDANREVNVTETFHLKTDDELSDKELKQIEADDQAIQTILLGLPEDIYAAVDSCETAQEIWLRVQQMMKGSDIGIQEKKAKLFNE